MAIPAAWKKVPVTAKYKNLDGSPTKGEVWFKTTRAITVGGEVVLSGTLKVKLDVEGALAIELPSTNDPDLSQTGWTYEVTEKFTGGRAVYAIEVPYDSAGIDLSTAPPMVPVAQLESTLGPRGHSAYEVAVSEGFEGTAEEWLATLGGIPGPSAYESAVANGFVGTEVEWLASLKGDVGNTGDSAYDRAVALGFVGTEAEWLASLEGADGADGADGAEGPAGSDAVWTQITQAEYDALNPPDPDTLYLVIG